MDKQQRIHPCMIKSKENIVLMRLGKSASFTGEAVPPYILYEFLVFLTGFRFYSFFPSIRIRAYLYPAPKSLFNWTVPRMVMMSPT